MGCTVSAKLPKNKTISSFGLKLENLKIHASAFVNQNSKRFLQVYQLGHLIGTGSIGQVRKCHHRDTGIQRAVKIIRKHSFNRATQASFESFINILRSLDHPNIIKIFEYFQDSSKIYIVIQLCRGGTLQNEYSKRHIFSQIHTAQIMHQVFLAVAHFHSQNISHRNLTPKNILLQSKRDISTLKIIGFQSSIRTNNTGDPFRQVTDISHLAPQIFWNSESQISDLWSCGVLMYSLLSGSHPFTGQSTEQIKEKIRQGKVDMQSNHWTEISYQAKDLIRCLLSPSHLRISAQTALTHIWIKQKSGKSLPGDRVVKLVFQQLGSFGAASKLKDAVHTFISNQCLSRKDTRFLKEVFKTLDKNGDGRLSREELLEEYTQTVGVQKAENHVDRIMKAIDSNFNGYVEYTEFLKATVDQMVILSEQNLRAAFRAFDRDLNGSITAQELKKVFLVDSESDEGIWEEIIREVDQNGDGVIDLQEFKDVIMFKIT